MDCRLSHYLNQCLVIVNWTLQWNFVQNTKKMIYQNTYENFVCEMAAIYSRGRWVKAAHIRFTINSYSSIHFSIHSAICSSIGWLIDLFMVLFLDTQKCMLHIRRECRDRFPRHQLQRKRIVIDPVMHQARCVRHVSWCMSGSQTRSGGEDVPGIPGACTTHNFTYAKEILRR